MTPQNPDPLGPGGEDTSQEDVTTEVPPDNPEPGRTVETTETEHPTVTIHHEIQESLQLNLLENHLQNLAKSIRFESVEHPIIIVDCDCDSPGF